MNNHFIGQTGDFPPEWTNPWNVTRIYTIPDSIVKEKNNELIIQVYFESERGGIFEVPVVGERDEMEDLAQLRAFYYNELYKITSFLCIFAALIFMLIYFNRKKERAFLYFSFSLLMFSIWSVYHFIWSVPFAWRHPFFSSILFHKLLWISLFSFVYFLVVFVKLFAKRNNSKVAIRFLHISYPIIIFIYLLIPDFLRLEIIRKYTFIWIFIIVGIIVYWLYSAIKEDVPYSKRLMASFFLTTMLSVFDIFIDIFNLYLPYFSPISIPLLLAGISMILISQFVDSHNIVDALTVELNGLNKSFQRFVPNQFLGFLNKKDISKVNLGDSTLKKMTVLFSDIRSFTALSEEMDTQDTFKFLNSYLKRMDPHIIQNDGFIDKFIGDAIMALFQKNNSYSSSDNAVMAALDMLKELMLYNSYRETQGFKSISIGFGINTGELMLGTMGSMNRLDTTVIGNTVNLASRLESLTKFYNADIIISNFTYQNLTIADDIHIREVDSVIVVGKKEPIIVYEVFEMNNEVDKNLKEKTKSEFASGIVFYKVQQFTKALGIFENIKKANENDTAAQIYIDRCQDYINNPPGTNWVGTTQLRYK